MDQKTKKILELLSDGQFHSGERLAELLGCSRTAVWNMLTAIKQRWQINIDSVSGKGYRLSNPVNLLDKTKVLEGQSQQVQQATHFFDETESTNQWLLQNKPENIGGISACFAEYQVAGKGRRGRQWVSPFGQNIIFSLALHFDLPMQALSGLSIASAVIVAEILKHMGVEKVSLKWPNDVQVDGKKVAGILLEASGESQGPSIAVIGVGINCAMDGVTKDQIEQPYTSLANIITYDRNELARNLLERLSSLIDYSVSDLPNYIARWKIYDRLQGKEVYLITAERKEYGVYEGLDALGGVIINIDGELHSRYAGEVSLREYIP